MSAKSRLAPNKPVFDSSWSTCFNEAINKLCLSAKKLWKLPANELIQTFCGRTSESKHNTIYTISVCVCVCVLCESVCAPKRLQLSTFGPHKADATLITDANSKKCDKHRVWILFTCVCVCAALGQLMETKDATHTHRYTHTKTHTHTYSSLMQIFLTFTELCIENYASHHLVLSLIRSFPLWLRVFMCVCVWQLCDQNNSRKLQQTIKAKRARAKTKFSDCCCCCCRCCC